MESRLKAETTLTVSIPLAAVNELNENEQVGQPVLQIDAPLDDVVDSNNTSVGLSAASQSATPSTVRRGGGNAPTLGNTASQFSKPVLASSQVHCCPPEQWVPEAPVVNCMSPDCTNTFSLFNRKHRCRMCGRVFCSSCAANVVTVPASAIGTGRSVVAAGNDDGLAPIALAASTTNNASSLTASRLTPGRGDASTSAGPSLTGSPVMHDSEVGSLSAPISMRVCNGCYYEMQLVVSTRREDGTKRRKSRGELKLFQKALVVNILSFLTLRDLGESSRVSSDFYFMARDNVIWYQYNMLRWAKDAERPQKSLVHAGYGINQQYKKRLRAQQFEASAVIQDATALTESEAAKRVISLHARYNFTQFLDFTRRQEMARCEGMSSFSVGARVLCASPIKLAIIGPCRVGKTAAVHAFHGDNTQRMLVRPTIGFSRCTKSVRLAGGVVTEVVLHIYDVSGEPRYEALRRFICRQCHAVGLCYDPLRKLTLVQAADIMMGIEPELGPQPVVVCGLIRRDAVLDSERRAAAAAAAAAASVSPAGGTMPPRVRSNASLTRSEAAAASVASIDGESTQDRASPYSPPPQTTAASPSAQEVSSPPPESLASPPSATAGAESRTDASALSAAAAQSPATTEAPLAATGGVFEVTEQDAVDITVRGRGSLQCDVLEPTPFFQMLVQSLLSRLAEATMVPTATVAEISQEISTNRRAPRTPQESRQQSRFTSTRRPKANVAAAQELLNITMQPSPLDILVDR